MRTFHNSPDDVITIQNGPLKYIDTRENFQIACEKAGLPLLPEKPAHISGYFVDTDGVSYATEGNNKQVAFAEVGVRPEAILVYIDQVAYLVKCKKTIVQ